MKGCGGIYMQEVIGKVVLDLSWYGGKDLYSDGDVEDELLKIVSETPESELDKAAAGYLSWPVIYHLSSVRENIVASLPLTKQMKVLEIGAGCGAVTGALARRAGHVTCIDLSKKRCLINAHRHSEYANIDIIAGNFQDIEPSLPDDYDCITLIGVFEYAKEYIKAGSCDPYREFLLCVRKHLKESGRLAVAIENRLGMKYFAGCREDHSGRFFDGMEGYMSGDGSARTFSKPKLERMFADTGYETESAAYPYPDYKLPYFIFSDRHLPAKGQLKMNNWNFDRDRALLFNEASAYDAMIEDGLYSLFANSYLYVLRRDGNNEQKTLPVQTVYAKFSGERAASFALNTFIEEDEEGRKRVVKTARLKEGNAHIERLSKIFGQLSGLWRESPISVNKVLSTGKNEGLSFTWFEYVPHRQSLEGMAGELWDQGRTQEAVQLIKKLSSLIAEKADGKFTVTAEFEKVFGEHGKNLEDASLPVTDVDMVAENILLSGKDNEDWTLIDYEWTFDFPVPVHFLIYRIWHYFYARYALCEVPEHILKEEKISAADILVYKEMEECFQRYVQGDIVPLRELYAPVSPGIRDLRSELSSVEVTGEKTLTSTLYFGDDEQFSTGRRAAVSYTPGIDGSFKVSFTPGDAHGCSFMRWDPVEQQLCSLEINRVVSEVPLMLVPMNGFSENGTDTFWTLDPAYKVCGDVEKTRTITIEGKIKLLSMSEQIPVVNQIKLERDAYYEEMQRLRAWSEQTRATIGYKGVEGLRRTRNYVMARVHGTKLFRDPDAEQKLYAIWCREHDASARELEGQRKAVIKEGPSLSLVVPAYRTPHQYLREMIDSVLAQTYQNWELCIADGSENDELTDILKEYAAKDKRILIKKLEKNEGISGNTNQAAALATGDYIIPVDHDDLLSPDALYEIAARIASTKAPVLYTDEDKIDMEGKGRFDPNLKPDYSPDLLRSHNYITHLFVVSRELFEETGGFRSEYDGAQDYDLILRCCEKADRVEHIARVLYHWRCHPQSTAENPNSKLYAYEAGKRAVQDHLKRIGRPGKVSDAGHWGLLHVSYEIEGEPLVSVIIPNKDHVKDLERAVGSLLTKSDYKNLEILIVENNSEKKETFACYSSLKKRYPQVKVLHWQKEFNYAAINNYAAKQASGSVLLLLNNDTKLIEPGSIREMLGHCLQKETGCVGAKLLFKNDTVQHAGIILGPGGFAGHIFSGISKDAPGFMMRSLIAGNYTAVTGACLMIRKDVYRQVGGMREDFAVALNDVDLCLKVRSAGYLNVFTPFASWYHYESLSRGYETTPEKKERFEREVELFRQIWGSEIDAGDPYYNPQFDIKKPPFMWW